MLLTENPVGTKSINYREKRIPLPKLYLISNITALHYTLTFKISCYYESKVF